MQNVIQTAWCVLTGAPSCGKTTVLKALESLGYTSVPEAARAYIEKELSQGRILQDIRHNEGAFQHQLITIKMQIESALPPEQIIFLDRALPDSISYLQIAGLDCSEALKAAQIFRYSYVFVFDPLPLQADGVRIENPQTITLLDKQLEQDYRNLGYDIIRIPVMPTQERVNLILQRLKPFGQ